VPDDAGAERPESEFQESAAQEAPRSRLNSGLAFLAGLVILGLLIYFGIAQGMAALAMFPGIPLVLLWFVYWFFLRRLIRIRRIRGIRERRLMNEAAQRDRQR
jgi:hypothetical protein